MSDQLLGQFSEPSGEHGGGIAPDLFRAALGRFATGVCVVTAYAADGPPVGVTISAFASLSLEPPYVLFCLDRATNRLEVYLQSRCFAVSVLSQDQEHVSNTFAGQGQDRFDIVPNRTGVNGCRLIDGAVAQLECQRVATHDGGDHIIFVARVDRAMLGDGEPLIYFRGAYSRLAGEG